MPREWLKKWRKDKKKKRKGKKERKQGQNSFVAILKVQMGWEKKKKKGEMEISAGKF